MPRALYQNLSEFLCEDIRTMLDNKQYEAAYLLSTYLFVKVGNVDMDDSDAAQV